MATNTYDTYIYELFTCFLPCLDVLSSTRYIQSVLYCIMPNIENRSPGDVVVVVVVVVTIEVEVHSIHEHEHEHEHEYEHEGIDIVIVVVVVIIILGVLWY